MKMHFSTAGFTDGCEAILYERDGGSKNYIDLIEFFTLLNYSADW